MHVEDSTPVIEIEGLSRRFGTTAALERIDLEVPRGVVFGLLGENGAGKTTLIKHMLGLLRAQTGTVTVFGLDPVENPTGVLSRIGYLSEESDLPGWMRVDELLRFTRTFYPSWNGNYAEELRQMFELDANRTVQALSKGQRARLGLILALAHRPELLVLDEPSSGLDPLVRRDILRAIIRTVADEGRTVLFSSHLLDEVESVADHVAIVRTGRIVENGSLESLKAAFHRVDMVFTAPQARPERALGFFDWQGSGRQWSALFRGYAEDAERLAADIDARLIGRTTPTLNEIFIGLLGKGRAPEATQP